MKTKQKLQLGQLYVNIVSSEYFIYTLELDEDGGEVKAIVIGDEICDNFIDTFDPYFVNKYFKLVQDDL